MTAAGDPTEDELARWEALAHRDRSTDILRFIHEAKAALPRLVAAVRERDARIAELEKKLALVDERLSQ